MPCPYIKSASEKRGVQWIDPFDDEQAATIAIKVSQPSFGSAVDTCSYEFDINLRLPLPPNFMAKVTGGSGDSWVADIYPDGPAVDGTTFPAEIRVWGVDNDPAVYVPVGDWIDVQRWPDDSVTGGYRYEYNWKPKPRLGLVDQKAITAMDDLQPGSGGVNIAKFDGAILTFENNDSRQKVFNTSDRIIANGELVELYGFRGYLFARYPSHPIVTAVLTEQMISGSKDNPSSAHAIFNDWDTGAKHYTAPTTPVPVLVYNVHQLGSTLPVGALIRVHKDNGSWQLLTGDCTG